MILYTK